MEAAVYLKYSGIKCSLCVYISQMFQAISGMYRHISIEQVIIEKYLRYMLGVQRMSDIVWTQFPETLSASDAEK